MRFTEEFKKLTYGKKCQGVLVAETMRQCGIDSEVLGASRVEGFSYTLNRKAKQENGFSDGRNENRRHPATAGEETDSADFDLVKRAYEFRGYKKGLRSIYMRLLHPDSPVVMNIKKIRRLMRKYGLFCPIREANPYLFYRGGVCCLSPILDDMCGKYGAEPDDSTVVHSDQGCHYTGNAFIRKLQDASFVQSMSRKGNCWDNAPQESFFGHMKDEISMLAAGCDTFEQIRAVVDEWMNYYNSERYQWDLEKLSPGEYYRYRQTGVYPLKPGFSKDRSQRFSAFVSGKAVKKAAQTHCLRESAAALRPLLSIVLSSAAGKLLHLSLSGGSFYPLKFKIVLDMGCTSNPAVREAGFCGNRPGERAV